ncbi:hypothetical protein Tco_1538873, partial [Tanacetum coccineum]
WDQPPLQIIQMMYCFVNNIHVKYVELLWEGLYYSLHYPTSLILYPRFTKIIVSHYMTIFPEISRRARDMYHNLQDDDIMKNIFNLGRHKDKVGMQIPYWMITEEMKHMEHYRMYAKVFALDVPPTQSQPTKSTQGTYRTPSAPRSPNLKMDTVESSAPKWSTVIHFRLPERRSTLLTPPTPVATIDKADGMILQDMIRLNIPCTRLEPGVDKESPEVEITMMKRFLVDKSMKEDREVPSPSGNQEQVDDYDFWTDSYASDDDEIPMKQVLQDIMEEISLTIDEAKLKKMADEMLRQRCTLGE